MSVSEQSIDAVVCWVDGDDPVHKKKLALYRAEQFKDSDIPDDLAGDTRFKSEGEIFFCIGSILKFAPFIRKIFIITDNQDPGLDNFVRKNFPDSTTQLEIVDHTVLFKGYESYLPVFNSLAIETLLYKIPDLSERFVYFNDDFCLLRPVTPNTWFDSDGRVRGYGTFMNAATLNLLRRVKPLFLGRKTFGFKDSMINGLPLIGVKGRFFAIGHTPHAMTKSFFQEFYAAHPEYVLINIKHKFREASQFNPQCLFYNAMLGLGKCTVRDYHQYTICVKPVSRSQNHLKKKLSLYDKNPQLKFFCVNSLDQASEDKRRLVIDWLKEVIGVTL